MAAGILICACTTTNDRGAVFYLTPVFILAALQTARTLNRLSTSDGVSPSRGFKLLPVSQRVIVIAIAFGLSLPLILSIRTLDQKLTQWAVQVLQFDRKFNNRNQEIGLSGDPELRSIFNPTPSLDRALLLHDTRGERHIRVASYSTYANRRWGPTANDRGAEPFANTSPTTAGHPIRFTALTDLGECLPLPTGLTHIDAGEAKITRDAQSTFHLEKDHGLSEWTATESTPDGPASLTLLPEPGVRTLLQVPEVVDPAVRELARSVAGTGPAMEKLRRLEAYLRSTNQYSLRYDAPDDGDPINDFILNKRAAHCQYFATALTVMARCVGIPSRLVIGFYAHEPDGDDTLVRQRDAHAWVEAYIDGPGSQRGWYLADATPAGGRPDELFEQPSRLRKFWESITDLPGKLREFIAGGALVKYLLPLFAIGAIIAAVKAIFRRRAAVAPETFGPTDPELQTILARIEKLLATRDLRPSATQTWRDVLPPELQPLLPHYNSLRFGQLPTHLPELNALLTRLESSGSSRQLEKPS